MSRQSPVFETGDFSSDAAPRWQPPEAARPVCSGRLCCPRAGLWREATGLPYIYVPFSSVGSPRPLPGGASFGEWSFVSGEC